MLLFNGGNHSIHYEVIITYISRFYKRESYVNVSRLTVYIVNRDTFIHMEFRSSICKNFRSKRQFELRVHNKLNV